MSSASRQADPQHTPASHSEAQTPAHHGEGSSSSAAALSATATAFVPGGGGGRAASSGASGGAAPAGSVAPPEKRQGAGGRGGRGGRGRGGLSRELQGRGGGASGGGAAGGGGAPRQHQHSAPQQGADGSRQPGGGGRQRGEGAGGGSARHAGESGAGGGGTGSAGVLGTSPGRRGYLAANHLLGFQSRREGEQGGRGGGGRGGAGGRGGRHGGRAPPRRPAPKPQPYDRNKFLQANFRFLVSDAVDARRFEADPDRMLEWEDVVQVEMLSAAPVRCPITLDERPLCPQITPCGHVFSFPAIIGHLVAHGGPELRKSAPCPLCYTQIAARELRLVQVHRVEVPSVGQPATFQLLRRPRDGITPELAGGEAAAPTGAGGSGGSSGGSPGAGEGGAAGGPATGSPGKGGSAGQGCKAAWPASGGSHSGGGAAPSGSSGTGSAAAGGRHGKGGPGKGAATATACNRFSKFTMVSEANATAMWVAEAERLAQYAAQVTSEGGIEAAYEAPNVYSAIDALAARARTAAERRQRLLLEAADPMAQDALLSPEEAGAQAAAAVKGATTAALSAAAVRREQQAAAAARDQQFPSLAAAAVPQRGVASGGGGGWGAAARAQPPPVRVPSAASGARAAVDAEPAFSDDEGPAAEDRAATTPGSSGPRAGAPAGPASAALPIGGGGRSGTGCTAELSSSVRSAGGLLGGSPADAAGAAGTAGDYFFYQAADGQWLFLCPLNLRILLAHFGSYPACPPAITAKVLELEDVVQDEASRRRMRVLGHLPLTATFRLCEVDLSGLLPPEALVPFGEELAAREKRRAQRAKQEARRLKAERAAAAAAAAAAANTGLSAAELRAMPLPSASLLPIGLDAAVVEDAAAAAAVAAEGEAEAGSPASEPARAPPQPGVSFAAIARDGFAATGPTLGSSAGAAASPTAAAAPRGTWGPKPATPAGPAAWGPSAGGSGSHGEAAAAGLAGLQLGASPAAGGKGKGKKVVLFGGPQRKY